MPELPYKYLSPSKILAPILISCPHAGTGFPQDLQQQFNQSVIDFPEDTDWHIHQMYMFAPDSGLPLIHSRYSRYVIDLNRPKNDENLYNDGRRLTGLCPRISFAGQPLYKNENQEIDTKKRTESIYEPYYNKIGKTLEHLRDQFGWALLLEGHSILSEVPAIHSKPFPPVTMSDQDGNTCPEEVSKNLFAEVCRHWPNSSYNFPFKGGNLTRHFGKNTNSKIHAVQFEMSQKLYLDERTREIDPDKSKKVIASLQDIIGKIPGWMNKVYV